MENNVIMEIGMQIGTGILLYYVYRRTVSIHGLWPGSTDSEFLPCIMGGTDPRCDSKYKFDINLIRKAGL